MKAPLLIFFLLLTTIVLISGFWPIISSTVLPDKVWGLYSREFFSDFLTGAHGSLIDLLIVGIVLALFERRRIAREDNARVEAERKSAVARNQESLSDLKYYKGSDSPYRTITVVKRLVALGQKGIICSDAKLSDLNIEDMALIEANLRGADITGTRLKSVDLTNSKLDGANLSRSVLVNVNLTNSSLARAKFVDAVLAGADFTTCRIERADFTGAVLKSANFAGADCRGVKFTNANLRSANFIGATNLSEEMLMAAKDITHIKTTLQVK